MNSKNILLATIILVTAWLFTSMPPKASAWILEKCVPPPDSTGIATCYPPPPNGLCNGPSGPPIEGRTGTCTNYTYSPSSCGIGCKLFGWVCTRTNYPAIRTEIEVQCDMELMTVGYEHFYVCNCQGPPTGNTTESTFTCSCR